MPGLDDELAHDILKRLAVLEDRENIRAVIDTYSRGVDRADTALMRTVFWPDARFPLGPPTGSADEFIPAMFGEIAPRMLAATHHLMGNTIIEVVGDRAYCETYAISHHRSYPTRESNDAMLGPANVGADEAGFEQGLLIGFRYLDVLEKRSSEWRILERRLVFDWNERGVYRGIEAGGLYDGTPLRGARRPNDATYGPRTSVAVAR